MYEAHPHTLQGGGRIRLTSSLEEVSGISAVTVKSCSNSNLLGTNGHRRDPLGPLDLPGILHSSHRGPTWKIWSCTWGLPWSLGKLGILWGSFGKFHF